MARLTEIEIYYADLKSETRKAVLEAYGVDDPADANLDIFPLTVLEIETEEDD